jgi:DNA repair protein RecO (recombination protein O)
MPDFTTPAIMLRKVEYGDFDLIITFFSLYRGKISVIAKSAKKSTKRFAGILELFSVLEIVCSLGRGRGMAVLKEAVLKQPFPEVGADILKTTYASYWAEIINRWLEENKKQLPLYRLLLFALGELDSRRISAEALSILFQMRFLSIAGLNPNLTGCMMCRKELDQIRKTKIAFDLARGGLVCEDCVSGTLSDLLLSKSTIKQLLWIGSGDLRKAGRIRFSTPAIREGLKLLEAFVPYHLGQQLKSLTVLHQMRGAAH